MTELDNDLEPNTLKVTFKEGSDLERVVQETFWYNIDLYRLVGLERIISSEDETHVFEGSKDDLIILLKEMKKYANKELNEKFDYAINIFNTDKSPMVNVEIE